MPHYTIELIPWREGEPSGGGVPDREERRFANLGEALQLAREMFRGRNATAKGFRIFNAGRTWASVSPPRAMTEHRMRTDERKLLWAG